MIFSRIFNNGHTLACNFNDPTYSSIRFSIQHTHIYIVAPIFWNSLLLHSFFSVSADSKYHSSNSSAEPSGSLNIVLQCSSHDNNRPKHAISNPSCSMRKQERSVLGGFKLQHTIHESTKWLSYCITLPRRPSWHSRIPITKLALFHSYYFPSKPLSRKIKVIVQSNSLSELHWSCLEVSSALNATLHQPTMTFQRSNLRRPYLKQLQLPPDNPPLRFMYRSLCQT